MVTTTITFISLLMAALSSSIVLAVQDSSISTSTCVQQNPCIKFTSTPVDNVKCSRSGVAYEICAIADFNSPGCSRRSTDRIDYTCLNNMNMTNLCNPMTELSSAISPIMKMVKHVKHGYTQCQTVGAGERAQFFFFDGDSCTQINNEPYHHDDNDSLSITCSPRSIDTLGCDKYEQRTECVWTVTAPSYKEQNVSEMKVALNQKNRQLLAPSRAPVTPTKAPIVTNAPVRPTVRYVNKWYFIDASTDTVLSTKVVNGGKYSQRKLGSNLNILVEVDPKAVVAKLVFQYPNINPNFPNNQYIDRNVPFTFVGDSGSDYYSALYLSYTGKKKIKILAYSNVNSEKPLFTETIRFRIRRR